MASDVEIVIKGKNESGPAFAEAKAAEDQLKISTKSLGDEFTSTGVKQSVSKQILKDLIGGYQNADSIIMGFSNHIEQSGNFSEYLDAQLGKLKSDAKLLGDELNRTGSIDVFGKLRENQSATKSLEKLKSDLTKALDDGSSEGGSQGGASFLDQFKGIVGGGGGGVAGLGEVLGYAAAAAAPAIGALIAAAVLGGIAAGGIATGIIGQLQDPAVKSAASAAGKSIMSALTADTAPFKQPILDAFSEISGAVTSLLGTIDFGTLAGEIQPLVDGISQMIVDLGPGINDAIAASQPVMQALGDAAHVLGMAISTALSEISIGGDGAAKAVRYLALALGGAIVAVGGLVGGLAWLYGKIVDIALVIWKAIDAVMMFMPALTGLGSVIGDLIGFMDGGSDSSRTLGRSLTDAGSAAAGSSDDYAALNQQLSTVTQNADTTAGAMSDKLFGALMNSDDAVLKFNESLTNLADTLKQNKDALDIHSKAGQQDREAILQAVQANIKMYDTMIQTGSSAQDAAHAYDQNTQALVKQMRQAGLTQSQIDGLIGKYAAVPDTVNTDIAVNGLTDAINNLNETLRLINGLHDKTVTLTYNIEYSGQGGSGSAPRARWSGGVVGAASGKTIGGGLTWTGEQGPELLSLPAGTTVHSNPDSMRMAAEVAPQQGGGTAPGRATLEFGGNLDGAMANAVKYLFYQGRLKLSYNGKPITVS